MYLRDPHDNGFQVLQQRAIERDATIVGVDDFGVLDWRIVRRAREQVQRLKPDIWHGHDYKSNLLGLMLRRYHPMKLVTTVHGWVQKTWKTPLYYAIDRRCLPRYDQVICVSQDLFEDCQRLGVSSEKLTLIDNAIAVEDYAVTTNRSSAKSKLGFFSEPSLIAGVGRLSAEKGFDLLIEAVANLNRQGKNISLAIAGDGDERAALEALIVKHRCQEMVKLLGFVKDTRLVYQAADLFVLSSHREGLPNVVLEAMASGTPVLATRVAGMPNLIVDDVNGKLIEPGSVDQLEDGINELITNQSTRSRYANEAKQTVLERFDFASRMKKVIAVYQRLEGVEVPVHCNPISIVDGLIREAENELEFDSEVRFETQTWSGELPPLDSQQPRLLGHQAAWINAVSKGLGHDSYLIVARTSERVVGVLPLCLVAGPIFGKFLVSLPYVNTGGVWAANERVAQGLIDSACELADQLDVKHLELRHEIPVSHDKLNFERTDKVHLRLLLPSSVEKLLTELKSKVRSQVKKSQQSGLTAEFGGSELLNDFHHVFATNMRDLGTPVFSRTLFAEILNAFAGDAELCIVRSGSRPVAGALLVHAEGVSEVPSASCLRKYNGLNANMFMYWHLLKRAIHRNSQTFDFGRSSRDSGTFRFKAQWGAEPNPATWQYYVRKGNPADMTADSGSKQRLVETWKRFPVWLTKLVGPTIVRGIP